ncbi:hypothetical protein TNIN_123141 [Trichonephila inaurata madagascariensis]|uniref:Uncharacterized protein n=1 Tax=Trichonephila inaurata madagascariensis TaxID=2747483 RepID=A0A8X7C169_9ARAC|nr:hypothetical protein TNIN_123141 [Trichonephila inaurata madagascariensis]
MNICNILVDVCFINVEVVDKVQSVQEQDSRPWEGSSYVSWINNGLASDQTHLLDVHCIWERYSPIREVVRGKGSVGPIAWSSSTPRPSLFVP